MRKLFALGRCLAPLPVITSALMAALLFSAVQAAPAAAQPATHSNTPRVHVHNRGRHSTSTNWSGYATTGTTYSDVKGSWTQPAVSCTAGQTAYSSFWVGIDGYTSSTVEQTGADADCVNGTQSYYAWYEMYPKFPVNFSNPIRPGDHMSAEVKTTSSGQFVLTISDTTRGWSHSVSQRLKRAHLGSAEWIAEAPSGSSGVLPLADFGTVGFASCTADGVAISSNPNPDAITMVSSGGVKAQPSGLSSSGTAFSVTWKHS